MYKTKLYTIIQYKGNQYIYKERCVLEYINEYKNIIQQMYLIYTYT